MLEKIKNIAEFKTGKILTVYGESGTGKTTFSCTFPSPILFINIDEDGLEVTKEFADKKIDYIDIKKSTELTELLIELKTKEHEYKTIIVDTMTQLQNKIISNYTIKKTNLNFGEWGAIADEIKKTFSLLKILSKEQKIIVVTLWQQKMEEIENIEGNKQTIFCPECMKSVKNYIIPSSDLVLQAFKNTNDNDKICHNLRIKSDGKILVKFRTNTRMINAKLPKWIENPSWNRLLEMEKAK